MGEEMRAKVQGGENPLESHHLWHAYVNSYTKHTNKCRCEKLNDIMKAQGWALYEEFGATACKEAAEAAKKK